MPMSAVSRINYMCKKQCSVKGLKFGDRQNQIDYLISTGVEYAPDESLQPAHEDDDTGDPSEVT